MIRDIVKYGTPVLRAKGVAVGEIDDTIRALAADMIETMRDADGVGLAAQQVGERLQLAVLDVTHAEERPSAMWIKGEPVDLRAHMPMVLINPVLALGDEREIGVEGCLSFPEITGDIDRAARVKARARTLEGEIEFEATGLLARALQHEADHLNGILFIDRMSSAAKASLAGKLKRLQRK